MINHIVLCGNDVLTNALSNINFKEFELNNYLELICLIRLKEDKIFIQLEGGNIKK